MEAVALCAAALDSERIFCAVSTDGLLSAETVHPQVGIEESCGKYGKRSCLFGELSPVSDQGDRTGGDIRCWGRDGYIGIVVTDTFDEIRTKAFQAQR